MHLKSDDDVRYDVRFDDGDHREGLKRNLALTVEEFLGEFGEEYFRETAGVSPPKCKTLKPGNALVDVNFYARTQEECLASRNDYAVKRSKVAKHVYDIGTPCRAKWTDGKWFWGHVKDVRSDGDSILYSVCRRQRPVAQANFSLNRHLFCLKVLFDDKDTLDDIPQSYVLSEYDLDAMGPSDVGFEQLDKGCGSCSMCTKQKCGKCMTCVGNGGSAGKVHPGRHVCLLKVRATETALGEWSPSSTLIICLDVCKTASGGESNKDPAW